MGLFNDKGCRSELERLKLRLFGSGNTRCLNVSANASSDALMSEYKGRIYTLERDVQVLKEQLAMLKRK